MFKNVVKDFICHAFNNVVGKNSDKAAVFTFSKRLDYDKEDGYRQLELVITAPMNYVLVAFRETWTVINTEDLEDDGNGDTYVKAGKDYVDGASEWKRLSYHDSCWRDDGVGRFLNDNEDEILGIKGSLFDDNLFKIVDANSIPGLLDLVNR